MGDAGPRKLGLSLNILVSAAVMDIVTLLSSLPDLSLVTTPGKPLWHHAPDNNSSIFPAHRTWNQTRVSKPKINWARTIWFLQAPCYTFIVWLAIRDRLATGARPQCWAKFRATYFLEKKMKHVIILFLPALTIWSDLSLPFLGRKLSPDWLCTLQSFGLY